MPRPLPRLLVLLAVLPSLAGCETGAADPGDQAGRPPERPPASTFDPARCGTITGRVVWSGPEPVVPPFMYGVPRGDKAGFEIAFIPNPNAPRIVPASRAVAGAVVFLRGVNPAAAKPWDHPPARVELRDRQILVRQGDGPAGRAGFVRRGSPVEMASAEPAFHVLRARGAAFFSLAFPDPGRPLTRTLDQAGRVELTSGAGYYWAAADLFVDDHPYYALTDAGGRFSITQVPAGPVELAAWLPGWDPVLQERDPESGLVARQTYAPPLEVVTPVRIEPGRSTDHVLPVPPSPR